MMHRFPDLEVLTDPGSLLHYGRDWTRFWPPAPAGVVFPRSTADLVDLVRWARSERQALVPSGGRTGLSGGAVARAGELVVSMEKMRGLVELNTVEPSLTAQAGMTVGEVQRRALDAGLYYPVDWAAAASSQLGGSIATNAGGIRVLRHGMTRDWVLGLTVVDGRGEVLELRRGLIKNNAGPDLSQLMIGSEGIFGFITEATLGLKPFAGIMFINQLRLEHRDDTGFSSKLATSIVRDLGGPAKLELGLVAPISGPGEAAIRLGTWLEF